MSKDYTFLEHEITSVTDLIDRRIRSGGEAVSIYRGHCVSTWNLSPSLLRLKSLPGGFRHNSRDFEANLWTDQKDG
jgi:hypothetical protein